jgi:hypothetical protein
MHDPIRNGIRATCAAALLAAGSPASAAALTCYAATTDHAVTVDSAAACVAKAANWNDSGPKQGGVAANEDALVFQPGDLGPSDWTYLDKDNRSGGVFDLPDGPIAGTPENWFFGSIGNPGANTQGTFAVDFGQYSALGYNRFLLFTKPGNEGFYFLLDGTPVNGLLTGTWQIASRPGCTQGPATNPKPCSVNGVSHLSLYGRYVEDAGPPESSVPEPGTLALFGLAGLAGLAGLGMVRRRR